VHVGQVFVAASSPWDDAEFEPAARTCARSARMFYALAAAEGGEENRRNRASRAHCALELHVAAREPAGVEGKPVPSPAGH
jgi:hypothetical protein